VDKELQKLMSQELDEIFDEAHRFNRSMEKIERKPVIMKRLLKTLQKKISIESV